MYEKLLFPIRINNRNIKNKIVAAPPPSFLCEKDGSISPQFFQYYKKLANSEPGILIIEGSAISNKGKGWQNQLVISEDVNFLAISELVINIRNHDILPMIQLYHGGLNAIPGDFHEVLAPSEIKEKNITAKIHPLTTTEIEQIVDEYKKAASLVWNVGFSGVELNVSENTLIHQFLSPITNKRKDEYAFGYDNGILLLRKIITAIKSVAPDLLFSLKLSLRDLIPGGSGLGNSIDIANGIKELGIDLFHLTEGLKFGSPYSLHPYICNSSSPAPFAEDALIFKKETNTTTIMSTEIQTPDIAEKYLSKEICDFISIGRTLNREPEWITMAMSNQPVEFFKKCKKCLLCKAAKSQCVLE